MNRVELMPLVTTYQGTGNLGICSVDCCKASSCQDLWLIPIFPKSAESGCGMWAERVLPYFERSYPADDRPRRAIEAGRVWARTGVFRMAAIRKASLGAHSAARAVEGDNAARSAARAAGQAVATTHVPTHSVGAAIYAASAVRDAAEASDADTAVAQEREWEDHPPPRPQ